MSSLMDELRDAWSKVGAGPNPGASLDDVRRFEEAFNVVLPDDAREYFCSVNGARCDDNQMIAFASLAELKSIRETYPSPDRIPGSSDWFIFADYLCQTHLYIIEMQPTRQPTSRIVFVNGEQGVMAPSLHEFFRRYLSDPEAILLPTGLEPFGFGLQDADGSAVGRSTT